MHVGADREQLRGDRADAAPHRHPRRDRRQVGAERAGVHELSGQQPVEIGAAGGHHLAGRDRDDVDGRAADVDHQGVWVQRGDRERARQPVGGRDLRRPGPRLREGDRSPAVVKASSSLPCNASCAASSTNSTPSRFARNASESSAVVVSATASTGSGATPATTSRITVASASRSRQTSNGRDRARRSSPFRHTAFVFAPPTSRPITPPMRDPLRPCE